MGDYDKALSLYEEAKEIIGRVLGKNHPAYAKCINNLNSLKRLREGL